MPFEKLRKEFGELLEATRDRDRLLRLLAGVVDAIPQGVALSDRDGRLIRFNKMVAELDPVIPPAPEEWPEYYGCVSCTTGKLLEYDKVPLYRALHNGETVEDYLMFIDKPWPDPDAPRIVCYIYTAFPVYDTEGQIDGAAVIFDLWEAGS